MAVIRFWVIGTSICRPSPAVARLSSVGGPSGASLDGRRARQRRARRLAPAAGGEQVQNSHREKRHDEHQAGEATVATAVVDTPAGIAPRRCAARNHAIQGTRSGRSLPSSRRPPTRPLGLAGWPSCPIARRSWSRAGCRWWCLPLIVIGTWQVLLVVNHAVFIFVIAALIAILLNPIVRAFCALRVPAVCRCCWCTSRRRSCCWGVIVILGTIVTNESQVAIDRVDCRVHLEDAAGTDARGGQAGPPAALDRHVQPVPVRHPHPRRAGRPRRLQPRSSAATPGGRYRSPRIS